MISLRWPRRPGARAAASTTALQSATASSSSWTSGRASSTSRSSSPTRTCRPSSRRPVPPRNRRRSPSPRPSPPPTSTKGHDQPGGWELVLRDLGLGEVLEPVEVGCYEPLKLAAQRSFGQAERAARGSPDRLGEDRYRPVRGQAVLLVEAHRPGDAVTGETRGRIVAGYLIR